MDAILKGHRCWMKGISEEDSEERNICMHLDSTRRCQEGVKRWKRRVIKKRRKARGEKEDL